MALIKCSECGSDLSDKAAACPKCGAPNIRSATAERPTQGPPSGRDAADTASPISTEATAGPVKSRRVRPFTLILFLALIGIAYLVVKIKSGSSLRGAVAGPRAIVSETVSLEGGQAKSYGFTLAAPLLIDLSVDANPRPVNVMLMSEDEYASYEKARQKLLGGHYTYRQSLSSMSVLHLQKSDVLPDGAWRVVLERPQEGAFGGRDSSVTVKIVGY